jgi:hypothetical protein
MVYASSQGSQCPFYTAAALERPTSFYHSSNLHSRAGKRVRVNKTAAPHGLSADLIAIIHEEIAAALASLKRIYLTNDSPRILATILLLQEVLPEFIGTGRRPGSAIRWLERANQLLGHSGASDIDRVLDHTSAAWKLLTGEQLR